MMELMGGEAGVLRTALGVVLGMEGIDARVRLFLWSGGVEDAVLPTLNAAPYPPGAQVVVLFLSARPESGMVVGTVDGLLSWRRTAPPAFVERMQPQLLEIRGKARSGEGALATYAGLFSPENDDGMPQCNGCVLLADGRVFFVPSHEGSEPRRPHIWDPLTGALHTVPWTLEPGDYYCGGVLLLDGRVFFMPHPLSAFTQARIYDPELDRVNPAGPATEGRLDAMQPEVAGGHMGCVLLPDGRVLLVPHTTQGLTIYDPRADAITASQVDVAALLPGGSTGMDFQGGMLLPDGRVLLVPYLASAALVYDPATDTATAVEPPEPWAPPAFSGGVLLADGRVFLVPYGASKTWLFDPAHDGGGDSFTVQGADWLGAGGGWGGGVLLPDGRVALLPGMGAGVADMRIFNPLDGSYVQPPELAASAAYPGEYGGGIALPDGRVVIAPRSGRDLLVWDPGCGAGLGRDLALSGFWNKGV